MGGTGQAANPVTQLLSGAHQQQQPQQDTAGPILPQALQQILEPLQLRTTGPGPKGPSVPAGQGLLGAGEWVGPVRHELCSLLKRRLVSGNDLTM